MENIFIIMIFCGGFGLLLCTGAGLQILGSKASNRYRLLRDRRDRKKSPEKAWEHFKQYNTELRKENYRDSQSNPTSS